MTRNFIFCLLILFCLSTPAAYSQARLVLNGAQINITNAAVLVIDNAQPNALTRVGGSIVSEGENNAIKWNMANTTGIYTIPWGYGTTNYLPLTFTKSAGTGAGTFTFSTYHTGWQNSLLLPTGVTNLWSGSNDNSMFVIDRFWQINAQGYTGKPALTNFSFGYLDVEHSVPNNMIIESNLKAQRWNDNSAMWGDMAPVGTADIATNTVTITSLAATDLYKWWTLVDQNYILPVTFLSFEVQLVNGNARLDWTTAQEDNVKNFEVQKSLDGITFTTIAIYDAKGENGVNSYEYTDRDLRAGKIYYRIKENDRDSRFLFSMIRSVTIAEGELLAIYPNPVSDKKLFINAINFAPGTYLISLLNLEGRTVFTTKRVFSNNVIKVQLDQSIASGTYFLTISKGTNIETRKVVVN